MPTFKQSDRVRGIVLDNYVRPALRAGNTKLSIRARDVLRDAEANQDFPRGRTPLICNVLQSNKLLTEAGLEVESIEGPPSRQSRTVVVHYRVAESAQSKRKFKLTPEFLANANVETPEARASRLVNKIRGLMKDEIEAHGGAEGFIRWVRSDEDEA